MSRILETRREYNMENAYQAREAAGLFFHAAAYGFNGSLSQMWMMAERPHNWTPELDGRKAEAKALAAAEAELTQALAKYDAARKAAHEAAKR
jgi:hypothetical protein